MIFFVEVTVMKIHCTSRRRTPMRRKRGEQADLFAAAAALLAHEGARPPVALIYVTAVTVGSALATLAVQRWKTKRDGADSDLAGWGERENNNVNVNSCAEDTSVSSVEDECELPTSVRHRHARVALEKGWKEADVTPTSTLDINDQSWCTDDDVPGVEEEWRGGEEAEEGNDAGDFFGVNEVVFRMTGRGEGERRRRRAEACISSPVRLRFASPREITILEVWKNGERQRGGASRPLTLDAGEHRFPCTSPSHVSFV